MIWSIFENYLKKDGEGSVSREKVILLGQKEKLLDDDQTEPKIEYAHVQSKMAERQEAESPEYPRPMPGDAVRLTEERFREPVTHAVITHAPKHDPFADIYLTGISFNWT